MGRAGEPWHHCRGASRCGTVESRVDVARSLHGEDKEPAEPSRIHYGGRRWSCRGRWIGNRLRLHRVAAARPSDRADPRALARQSHVRRGDADRLHRDAALSKHENGGRARQGLGDGGRVWEEGKIMLGFDAEERLIQRLPDDFAEKVVWGSRYPHHDTTSAHEAIAMLARANVPEDIIARMMGGNAAVQFGVHLLESADH